MKKMILLVVEECVDDLEDLLNKNGDWAEYINDVLYAEGINTTVYEVNKENA
jgi:hypothetical protein